MNFMFKGPHWPFSTRNSKILLLCLGILASIFLLSQVAFRTPSISFTLAAWPLKLPLTQVKTENHSQSRNRNETLGIASRIYVISLPGRPDRRKDMEHLRKTLGLRWTYMEAMDAKNPMVERILDSVRTTRERSGGDMFIWPDYFPSSEEYIEPWYPGLLDFGSEDASTRPLSVTPLMCSTQNNTIRLYDPTVPQFSILTPARIACWYSHLSVIQSVANDNTLPEDEVVIVLEDDVNMERDIRQRLDHVWPFLPRDWDMVYLGHCWSNETSNPALNANENLTALIDTALTHRTYIHSSKSPLCTHAYALSRSGARRLLVHLRYPLFAFSRAIDMAILWLIKSGRIKSFSVVPSIVVQRKIGNSDIMEGKGSGWKDELVDGVFES